MGKEESSYRITKDGKVFVYRHGRHGRREIVLKGKRAAGLAAELPGMDREREQLALARATGNFKRGNERLGGWAPPAPGEALVGWSGTSPYANRGRRGMAKPLGLIGAPTSMGAHAPGQEKAPAALRGARIAERLSASGLQVADHGDGPIRRWRPDKKNRYAQNLAAVVEAARETAGRVRRSVEAGEVPLVLGGDCTLEIGTVAGQPPADGRVGLVYFDLHTDLNVPGSVREGALDWMGVAHLLGVEGAAEALSRLGPRFPLMDTEDVFFFSRGPEQMTDFERETFGRLGLKGATVDEVTADPEGAAAAALAEMESRFARLLVHFDVDAVDFTDVPLSEDTGRNQGLPFDTAMRALGVLLKSERLGALTVTELNPDHGEEDGTTVDLFVEALVGALGGSPTLTSG